MCTERMVVKQARELVHYSKTERDDSDLFHRLQEREADAKKRLPPVQEDYVPRAEEHGQGEAVREEGVAPLRRLSLVGVRVCVDV